jgi:thioesterase domain-containing protein
MVRQLKAMGKDVRMLAMMDTNIQEQLYQRPLAERIAKKLFRQWNKLVFRLGTSFSYPADTWDYLKTIYTHRYKKLLDKNYDSENMPVFMMRIADKMEHAYYHYHFKPQHVKIDQFISEKRMFFIDDPTTMGWKHLAMDGIGQHIIPGDHKDMLFPPNDRIFAQTLQKKLDQLNQELANQQAT